MPNVRDRIIRQEIYKAVRDYLPEDHARPQSLPDYTAERCALSPALKKVLDLGCGEGSSMDLFQRLDPDTDWHGVDIEDSPEVKQRIRQSDRIASFNGVDLPYPDQYFDLIFCRQVLEHARHPDRLMTDAFRVLKPGGIFLGSVSYLEPYHSYSIFNFTPYGIVRVFEDAGFKLVEIRPEIDASLMILRQLFNRSRLLSPVWRHNFFYGITDLIGYLLGLEPRLRNFLKIQFSGHLIFLARRPES